MRSSWTFKARSNEICWWERQQQKPAQPEPVYPGPITSAPPTLQWMQPQQQQKQQQTYGNPNLPTSQPPSSGFPSYPAPTSSTHSSLGLGDISWSSVFELGAHAGSQAGSQAGAQGGPQFGTIMAAIKKASNVMSCCVQPKPDCSIVVNPPPAQHHQQQDLPFTVIPSFLTMPSMRGSSPSPSLQEESRPVTPSLWTPSTRAESRDEDQ